VPLTIAGIIIVVSLLGRNHAAVVQVLGSPLIAILLLLFVISVTYHMRLGLQVVIEDYIHGERMKLTLVMLNTFFTFAVGLSAAFAILKLSFGV
jgi:succinate dehydrogenase / fumarate reductase membrane anchor subunit